jgi:hypothetical protein
MSRTITRTFIMIALALCSAQAQPPAPVVVQAMPSVNRPAAAPAAPAAPNLQGALQALQLLKATNEEILKRQAATLLQLEEMEKAAEQIKIYSKRG